MPKRSSKQVAALAVLALAAASIVGFHSWTDEEDLASGRGARQLTQLGPGTISHPMAELHITLRRREQLYKRVHANLERRGLEPGTERFDAMLRTVMGRKEKDFMGRKRKKFRVRNRKEEREREDVLAKEEREREDVIAKRRMKKAERKAKLALRGGDQGLGVTDEEEVVVAALEAIAEVQGAGIETPAIEEGAGVELTPEDEEIVLQIVEEEEGVDLEVTEEVEVAIEDDASEEGGALEVSEAKEGVAPEFEHRAPSLGGRFISAFLHFFHPRPTE